eukprot:TRINITY_DN23888_c0_g1_i1.p1 TRINITY_DN23888_c0_g1~~TRINITY_DN23888_c0_g1_i1.p1  ORF type:complete len:166 (+),score=23.20 TRINITY_DN23888_c0_g1_i1:136-633(+)
MPSLVGSEMCIRDRQEQIEHSFKEKEDNEDNRDNRDSDIGSSKNRYRSRSRSPNQISNSKINKPCCDKCKRNDKKGKTCICVVPANQRRSEIGDNGCQTCGRHGCSKEDYELSGMNKSHKKIKWGQRRFPNKKWLLQKMFESLFKNRESMPLLSSKGCQKNYAPR